MKMYCPGDGYISAVGHVAGIEILHQDAVLLKENPVAIDVDVPGLNKEDRALLQKAAWQVCKSISSGKSK